ncbi:MAG: hypothetical protein ACYCUM_10050 [Solirubrobacteraceae bacterium]
MSAIPPTHTGEEQREHGVICYAKLPLFAVEHWVEGNGEHVFRSGEFDLIVGDRDLDTAVEKFVEGADDLWGFLEEQQNLTDGELALVSLLASRFRSVLRELERRERERARRRVAVQLRRRGQRLGTWTPGSSSQISHA